METARNKSLFITKYLYDYSNILGKRCRHSHLVDAIRGWVNHVSLIMIRGKDSQQSYFHLRLQHNVSFAHSGLLGMLLVVVRQSVSRPQIAICFCICASVSNGRYTMF